jgi:hypothetical protein
MSIPASAALAYEVEQKRDRTPRARALLNRVYQAQAQELTEEQRKSLDAIEYALCLYLKFKDDLTEAGELSFSKRLERVIGKEEE